MFIFILLGALFIRLIVAFLFFGPWDTESVYIIVDLLKKGSLVYNETWRYNTPPTWMWTMSFLSFLHDKSGIPLYFLCKLPAIIADMGIGVLLYKLVVKYTKSVRVATFSSVLYLLNPLPILISAYQGQIDSIFIFFILFSAYVILTPPKIKFTTLVFSGLLLGFAGTIKLVPLGIVPLFVLYIFQKYHSSHKLLNTILRLVFYSFLTIILLILEFIPYLSVWNGIVEHVFQYKTWWSLWGVSLSLRKLNEIWFSSSDWFQQIIMISKNQALSVVLVLLVAYFFIFFKKWSLTKSILFVFMTEYAISSFLAPQYLIWALPFFILEYCKNGKFLYSFIVYSLMTFLAAGTIYLFWQDETIFQYVGSLLKITDIAGFGFNLYAIQMIFPWFITLWWWKKMIFD